MNGIRQTCHCGHDISSHYRDESVRPAQLCSCLYFGCDCRAYVDRNEPAPKKPAGPRPKHPAFCLCFYCAQAKAAGVPPAPDTLDMLDDVDGQ